MYLSNIKLWNFRKYGSDENSSDLDLEKPNLDLNFTKWLNVLIWQNDSWKTAILDAIKLVLKTNSYEWIRIQEDDFYKKSTNFRIELIFVFDDSDINTMRHFTECLTVEWEWEGQKYSLNLVYEVTRKNERIFPSDVKAWVDWGLWSLSAEQRELLNITYLKPLRDVKTEFIPKKNSRLSSILEWHKAFKWKWKTHELYKLFEEFNKKIEEYFKTWVWGDTEWINLKEEIDDFIQKFIDNDNEWNFTVSKWELKNILEKLELTLKDNINPWLGSLNRLFIASELVHLQKENYDWLKLGLIEEIEAHIHPQAQMKVIEALQNKINEKWVQLILTTHSPNLASKVELENLIICNNNWAFPMGENYTKLASNDYKFLERFLDVTKSNLFFSEWVILVEWWAEEIILPTFAKLLKKLWVIEKDLTDTQTEIVNVWSDTFFRYANIFLRKVWPELNKKIAIITDMDLRPNEYRNNAEVKKQLNLVSNDNEKTSISKKDEIISILKKNNIITWFNSTEIEEEKNKKTIDEQWVKTFLTDDENWTLEYSLWLFPKFQKILFESVKKAIVDMRDDLSTTYSRGEETRDFTEIIWTDKEKSFEIYNNIMLNKKVSKPIVAQYFTEFLEKIVKEEVDSDWNIEVDLFDDGNKIIFKKEDFEWENSITYLINAIKYASNQQS